MWSCLNLEITAIVQKLLCSSFIKSKRNRGNGIKKGLKNDRHHGNFPQILFTKARKTGTVMATSPMADSRMTAYMYFMAKYYFYIRIFRTSFNRIFKAISEK
jgi:hypothetical protein